jgi:hypothetical protein
LLAFTQAKDMDTVMAFWNDSKDDSQNIATKYANGIRWYAAEGSLRALCDDVATETR